MASYASEEEEEEEEGKAPAEASSPKGQEPAVPEAKKKMRRLTQQQIDRCIDSVEPWLTPESSAPLIMDRLTEEFRARHSQDVIERLAAIDADRVARKARMLALEEMLREERQGILDQYYAKGYAEYEVDEEDDDEGDEEPAAAVPRAAPPRGRRRFRRGLVRRAGGNKRLN